MRVVNLEKLLEIFDEYEPDVDWFENEHELWLDLRLAVIDASTTDGDSMRKEN